MTFLRFLRNFWNGSKIVKIWRRGEAYRCGFGEKHQMSNMGIPVQAEVVPSANRFRASEQSVPPPPVQAIQAAAVVPSRGPNANSLDLFLQRVLRMEYNVSASTINLLSQQNTMTRAMADATKHSFHMLLSPARSGTASLIRKNTMTRALADATKHSFHMLLSPARSGTASLIRKAFMHWSSSYPYQEIKREDWGIFVRYHIS